MLWWLSSYIVLSDQLNCNILRGLNTGPRRNYVKALVEDAGASIVYLVESKLDVVNQFDILQILGPCFDGFIFLPAVHTCGGIIFAWQSSSVVRYRFRATE